MSATATVQERLSSSASRLAGWARQGIESFVTIQKILLDLTAQQNALAIGVVRERISVPRARPGDSIARIAEQSITNITAADKILLDLLGGESALIADSVKEGLRLRPAAGAVADLIRQGVDTIIDREKRLLEVANEQIHAVVKSYTEGKGLGAGVSVADLARRGIEGFVEAQKKFLDMAAEQVTAATEPGKAGKPSRTRSKVLTQLAKDGVDKYIEAQKRLLDLAIEQFEPNGTSPDKPAKAENQEPRTTLAELAQKSVQNFVTAQKSLMDFAIKPIIKPAATEARRKAVRRPTKRKK